jgi:hypothetical protein
MQISAVCTGRLSCSKKKCGISPEPGELLRSKIASPEPIE